MSKNIFCKTNSEILETTQILRSRERVVRVELLKYIAEIDRRKLFAHAGYSSLFTFLVQRLGYAKSTAYKLTSTARVAQCHPQIYDLLSSGQLCISKVTALAPLQKSPEFNKYLELAEKQTVKELEILVAARTNKPHPITKEETTKVIGVLNLEPEVSPSIDRSKDQNNKAETPRETDPKKFKPEEVLLKMSFVTSQATEAKLEKVKALLARKFPEGKMADVFDHLLDEFIERHDPVQKAKRSKNRMSRLDSVKKQTTGVNKVPREPRKGSRYVKAKTRHSFNQSEKQRQCKFISADGHRCGETRFLEYDHIVPFSKGGPTEQVNLQLLCRAHNQLKGTSLVT